MENIYLIGFMGTGKSTVGPIVANCLGFSFYDLDREIEKEFSMPVISIFEKHGEQVFREKETEILKKLSKRNHLVVSLGGGTITQSENIKIISATGKVFLLYADIDILVERLSRKKTRPLLLDSKGDMLPYKLLKSKVAKLLEEREKYYSIADYRVMSEENVGATVDKIVKIIENENWKK